MIIYAIRVRNKDNPKKINIIPNGSKKNGSCKNPLESMTGVDNVNNKINKLPTKNTPKQSLFDSSIFSVLLCSDSFLLAVILNSQNKNTGYGVC